MVTANLFASSEWTKLLLSSSLSLADISDSGEEEASPFSGCQPLWP